MLATSSALHNRVIAPAISTRYRAEVMHKEDEFAKSSAAETGAVVNPDQLKIYAGCPRSTI